MDFPARLFLDYSARKLRQATGRIEDCLGRLTEEQIWARGAESENAVGNLVLHLSGNVRQWLVAGVGGRPDTRHRDAEFSARGGVASSDWGRICAGLSKKPPALSPHSRRSVWENTS